MTRDMTHVEVTHHAVKGAGQVPVISIADVSDVDSHPYTRLSKPFLSSSKRAGVYPLHGLRANAFVVKVSLTGLKAVSREFYRMPPNFRYRYKLHEESMVSRFAGKENLMQFFELGQGLSALKKRVGPGARGAYRLLTVLRGAAFELKEVHKPRDVRSQLGRVEKNVRYVHHDIKPANFVVNSKDRVTLIDWELTAKAGDRYKLITVAQQKEAAEKKEAFEHCGPERFQQGSTGGVFGVARCADDMYGFVEMLTKTLEFIKDAPACFAFHEVANDILSNLIAMCGSKDLDERPSAEELYKSFSLLRKECLAHTSAPIDIPVRVQRRVERKRVSLAERKSASSDGVTLPLPAKKAFSSRHGRLFSAPVAPLSFERESVDSLEKTSQVGILSGALHGGPPVTLAFFSSSETSDDAAFSRSFSDSNVPSSEDLSGSSKGGTPKRSQSLVGSLSKLTL